MQRYKQRFSFFTILLLLATAAAAQTAQTNQIDSLMKRYSRSGLFNGNVLVARNSKILYNASFGFADAAKTTKLTTGSRFNIGSITKEFSAAALLQLQEQGRLQLDDKVSRFIPELPAWANEVSIRDLLQYTSGLPNVSWKTVKNDEDLFNGLKRIDTLDFKPGTQYDYNNNNIFLRQFIVERLTGMPFKAYAERFLFKPCKMEAAVMTPFEHEKDIALGFNNNLVQDKPDLPLTGGTYLTAADLLKWADCLHSKKVVNKNSLHAMGQQFDQQETQSALGQATFKGKNLIAHLHDGRAGNYEALLVSDIDEKITIILLGNNHNGKVFELSDAIMALLKGQEYSLSKK